MPESHDAVTDRKSALIEVATLKGRVTQRKANVQHATGRYDVPDHDAVTEFKSALIEVATLKDRPPNGETSNTTR